MYVMTSKPRSTAARVLVTTVAAITLGGCAMKGDIRDLQDEIRALGARQDSLITELRVEAQSTQDTIRTQGDQMFDFRGDIARQLRAISQSLATLEALAGENQRGIAGVRDQLANQRRTPVGPGPPLVVSDSTGGGERLLQSGGGNPDQLWSAAMEQYDRGSLNTASAAFEQFLAEYPDHAHTVDAHYYLADILTQQNRPEDALEAFEEIQQLFPTAVRVPDALYRIAVLQEELDDTDAARATLERLVNTYPDADIFMVARDMLRRIG